MVNNVIVIVDFGSQTTHLIARRIRDLGIKVKIIVPKNAVKKAKNLNIKGLILSGGPFSVYAKNAPTINKKIFELGLPILGICYGWQLMAKKMDGKVESGNCEYGPTNINVHKSQVLFDKKKKLKVWMSHGDEVRQMPDGFECWASSKDVKYAGVWNKNKKMIGLQFHPEVEHTNNGILALKRFVKWCGLKTSVKRIDVSDVINKIKRQFINNDGKIISAVSGGVDSSVASAIVAKAIGKRLIPVYIENGLMRIGTKEKVEKIFTKQLKIKPIVIKAKNEFLFKLKGIIDPEKKRKIIGNLYIDLFEKEAKKIKGVEYLVQGTIYSDVIESKGSKHANKIKSHHNVGGLPERMNLELVEPLRKFYKDEVRELGRQLGLGEEIIMTEPFPGPGQAIRIIGEVTRERLKKQQQADQIVIMEIQKAGLREKIFQAFSVMTGINSTAVKGDGRIYGEVVGLRVYESKDIMTAGWAKLPYEVLQSISSRIVNEVDGISRVVYDITTKPPATMEWE